ncbi:MAG: helix-turn-helix domain-containing protein, partial [Dehalococcoidia bacterium]
MGDNTAPDVPERLRSLRVRLELTQVELAQCLGVSVSSIIRWEHGHTRPTAQAMRQILLLESETLPPGAPTGPAATGAGSAEARGSLSPRAAKPVGTNIPLQLSSFVGRERE